MLWGKDLPLDGVLSSEAPRGELPETERPQGSGRAQESGRYQLSAAPSWQPSRDSSTDTGAETRSGAEGPQKSVQRILLKAGVHAVILSFV